ncbi:MAG: S-layer homology domain-containing protein [Clostridia bacterium]|nr:S-layer homology domain-containing protein [Clostridia bacterium]
MKRTIALLLVALMLFSALPVFASKTAEQEFSTDKIKGEVIIPFTDAETEGEYKPSTVVKGYDGGAHYWGGKAVTYNLTGIKKGRYELFFWVCPHPVCVEKLEFEILHAGETAKAVVYQATDEGETVEPGWVSLGVYEFSGDGTEYAKMLEASGTTRQSAVKFAPTKKDVTVYTEPVVEEKEENVNDEGVPVIGDKKPDSTSKLKDIEVLPAGKCRWEGDWKFSSAVLGPMTEYPNSLWIAGVGEEATVTYNPQIEAVGDVNVFVYLLWWHENQNPNVKYEVHHNGKVDTVMLDPTTLTESSWVYLGTFDFAGDMDKEFVKLICQQDENVKGNTRASTVMFEIVNTEGGIWQTKYVTPYESIETLIDKGKMAALNKFDDMKDHWAYYDVEYMANEGLVSGVSETEFDPEAQITRAEYVTILDRALGYELVTGASYADVPQDQWYATYVATAKENGLLNGLPTDDGFKPEQPITRQEMALFTYNAIQQIGRNDEWLADMPDDYAKFTDTAEVSDWAEEALKYLIKTGIIKGTTETTVSALENATRAQGAVILKRFMSYFVWAGPPTDQEWVMTFNDEFNGTEMDWSVWRSDSSSPGHIQSSRWPENVEVHDGAVHLVIRHEEKGGKEWTAGSVWVRPEVFAQKYGYWEARYKIAASSGINNSFWTYSSHTHNIHRETGTGRHFELDINEGHYPNTVNMTYHSDFETGKNKSYSSTYVSPYDLSVDYHTYALEWTPEELRFYHDGVLRSTQKNLNANQLQYPYLSSAVLNWAGKATDRTDGTAQIVDYVRIWQKKENMDDPTLNFKGEPMVGVGPAEQKPGAGTSDSGVAGGAGAASETVEFKTTTQTFAGEIVVPFDSESVVKEGEWKASTVVKGFDGGAHYWSGMSGSITYKAEGLKKGKYDVYYWLCPYGSSTAELVNLEINANGEKKVVASRQMLHDGETVEAGWVKLGTFDFKADGSEYVKAFPDTGTFRTSAVKFVPVK